MIIAYQVWYLSPSIPICSFLRSDDGRRALDNKPVVTVVGARNMWYRAHDRVKEHLRGAGARLVGHIALTDKAPNLVSVLTVVAWMLTARKQRLLGVFPAPGISEDDIRRSSVFGATIGKALLQPVVPEIQEAINREAGCPVVPHLLFLEKAAARVFDKWSKLILGRGGSGDPRRRAWVRTFGLYLACAIVIASPLAFLIFYVSMPFRRAAVRRQIQEVYGCS